MESPFINSDLIEVIKKTFEIRKSPEIFFLALFAVAFRVVSLTNKQKLVSIS